MTTYQLPLSYVTLKLHVITDLQLISGELPTSPEDVQDACHLDPLQKELGTVYHRGHDEIVARPNLTDRLDHLGGENRKEIRHFEISEYFFRPKFLQIGFEIRNL